MPRSGGSSVGSPGWTSGRFRASEDVIERAYDEEEESYTLRCATWNVASLDPAKDVSATELSAVLEKWLGGSSAHEADIVCVGLVEMIELSPVRVVRESIGLRHMAETASRLDVWRNVIHGALGAVHYELVAEECLCGLALFVFASRQADVLEGRRPLVASTRLGFHHKLGNKGAIAARLDLGCRTVCIVHAHLAADLDQYEARIAMYDACTKSAWRFATPEAKREVTLAKRSVCTLACSDDDSWLPTLECGDVLGGCDDGNNSVEALVLDHDLVVFTGDLNMRLSEESADSSSSGTQYNPLHDASATGLPRKQSVDELLAEAFRTCDFRSLVESCDQLTRARRLHHAFTGFCEAPITFPPTYKLDVTQERQPAYVASRRPAFCDRVLWRLRDDVQTEAAPPPGNVVTPPSSSLPAKGQPERSCVDTIQPADYAAFPTRYSDHMAVACSLTWQLGV